MKNHIRAFNKLLAEVSGDRMIDFELITEDQPMDMRRSLHRHDCHQLRIRIPADKALPIQVTVIYPKVCHCNLKSKEYDRYYIWLLDKERPDFSYPYKLCGTLSTEYFPVLTEALDKLRDSGGNDAEVKEVCRGRLRCMVQQYLRPVPNDPSDTKVQWLLRRFRNHYYRRELSIMREAKALGLSPNYVQRAFFAVTHQTPKAFLTQVRMEEAAKFLKERRYQVKQIAVMCGFKTLSHFSDTFRRHYGCSPGQFIKNAE